LTTFDAELGSSKNIKLVASCLTFPTPQSLLKSEFYNSRYIKNLSRGQTVTVQKWTLTVQEFVNEQF
jgi:hypothetical protein